MARQNNVRQFCWEQILRTNRLFRVSHLFTPSQLSDQLLALHALFASIELISSDISDESVALRKMSWWRVELSARQAALSNHPVVSHLHASGALEKLPQKGIALLLDSAEARIDAYAPRDEDQFVKLCQEIYRPQALLELSMGGIDEAINDSMLINGGIIQLLRESSRKKENALWWVPLSLLARFNTRRSDLEALVESEGSQAVFERVLQSGGSPMSEHLFDRPKSNARGDGHVHLQLMIALQGRQISRVQATNPAGFRMEFSRWHFGDLMSTWKYARQLNRSSGAE